MSCIDNELIRYDSCVEIQVHKLVFFVGVLHKNYSTELHKTLVDGLGPENTSLTFAADLGSGMDAGISSCFFKMGCFFCFVFFCGIFGIQVSEHCCSSLCCVCSIVDSVCLALNKHHPTDTDSRGGQRHN